MSKTTIVSTLGCLLTALPLLSLTACVSVALPTAKAIRAKQVEFNSPQSPFRSMSGVTADQAWMDEATGNTISYVSDCKAKSDPTLEQLQSEALNVLGRLKVLSEKRFDYNSREALVVTAQGEVDGVPVKMKLLTLKKNECNYSLTYSGVAKEFGKDLTAFDNFTQSFRAP